jgi:hypothetical protein
VQEARGHFPVSLYHGIGDASLSVFLSKKQDFFRQNTLKASTTENKRKDCIESFQAEDSEDSKVREAFFYIILCTWLTIKDLLQLKKTSINRIMRSAYLSFPQYT